MKHYSFPKIRQYHQVLRDLKLHHQYVGKDDAGNPVFDGNKQLPSLEFEGVTKIHGTNAAICFSPDGSFYCQSRENIIDEINDNIFLLFYGMVFYGFCLSPFNPKFCKLFAVLSAVSAVFPPPKSFFLNSKGAVTIAINCFFYSIFHISVLIYLSR